MKIIKFAFPLQKITNMFASQERIPGHSGFNHGTIAVTPCSVSLEYLLSFELSPPGHSPLPHLFPGAQHVFVTNKKVCIFMND